MKHECSPLYTCSRCGRCYVCHHTALFMGEDWVWKVRLRGGKIKFEKVIMDRGADNEQ